LILDIQYLVFQASVARERRVGACLQRQKKLVSLLCRYVTEM